MIRQRFVEPGPTLHELSRRIVFNMLTGRLDDHVRNRAALWDGRDVRLTPTYDDCPQPRPSGEEIQA